MRKLLILLLSIVVASISAVAATPTAGSLLADLRTKIQASPSVEAVFTLNSENGIAAGSVILAGNKYVMTTNGLKVWYDGKTQWTLFEASKEVNVTEPTAAEVMASNPFAILTAHQDFYTARRLKDNRVELVPRNKDLGFERFIIGFSSNDWPSTLLIEFGDGSKIDVKIDAINSGKAKSATTFTFDAKKYPDIDIIDLR